MNELPRGTVTFLFTDVEGSTRLLDDHGDGYAELLAEHRRLLRKAFGRHGGVEVDSQGDAFFVAFERASDALAAAAGGQEALRAGPVRVRMGLHTGEPLVTDEGYVGMDVHRAARIAAAGHGGQVLLSQATRELAATDGVRDLGEHRLKDLSAPERIYQLGSDEFPPLKTLYATNLPVPVTPFLGREQELSQVMARLGRADVRLLNLTGAGGSGKTRLALQAAAAVADEYQHGVWWVPLASVTDSCGVFPAAARALGTGMPLTDAVADRRLLLLLDNFEHVVEAAVELPELFVACPHLDVLVTSRERLRVNGEHVYPVPVLEREDARSLFVTRAREVDPDFRANGSLDELCARLDDLPLALELAAARTSLLTVEQLLERLGSRLDLLRGGRDAETRQRTLRATIEWSYELLTPGEQRLLAALSVFRGGWTVAAAEKVCDADVEMLESLVDKSLVRRWESGRFGMLETIREFVAERLAPPDRDELVRRLLEHLLEQVAAANFHEEALEPHRPELVDPERANIDVALGWALSAGEIASALTLMWRLELYFSTHDPVGARRWLDAFLERTADDVEPVLRARAVRVRGATYDMSGRSDLAEKEYRHAQALFRAAGDEESAAHLHNRIAMAAVQQGDFERAERLSAEALELDRRRGHRRDEAIALSALGNVALARGDRDEGVRLMHESAALAEEVGFVWWRGVTLGNLAEWLVDHGDADEAERALLASVEVIAGLGDRVNMPFALATAARVAALRGDAYRAGTYWGALQAAEEREPSPAWSGSRAEHEAALAEIAGPEFERGCECGRELSLSEALDSVRTPVD